MKELLKSKMMIGVALVLLTVIYVDSENTRKMDARTKESEETIVAINLR